MKITPKLPEVQGQVSNIDPKEQALQNALNNKPASIVDVINAEQSDQADISNLGAALNQQLNPTQMVNERQAKINSIKEQIKNGTYNPPLTDVAQSLVDEISSEILYTGGLGPTTSN